MNPLQGMDGAPLCTSNCVGEHEDMGWLLDRKGCSDRSASAGPRKGAKSAGLTSSEACGGDTSIGAARG